LRGGNPYRAKAYTRSAENLLALTKPLGDLVAQDRLKEIPGVGDAIADIITKLHKTGDHPSLQAMRKEKAAKADRLKPVKGLGGALQTKMLQGIEIRRKGEGRWHMHRAAMLLETAQDQLRRSKLQIKQILPAGDFRRGCELVADLALVVETSDLEGEPRKLASDSQLSVWLIDERRLGATLMLATGSQDHIAQLRELAAKKNMTLDSVRFAAEEDHGLGGRTDRITRRPTVCLRWQATCDKAKGV
jgi:DNA polymerase (family X)